MSPTRPLFLSRLLAVLFVAVTFAQVALDAAFSFVHIGGDFSVRYNEVECLKTGVDPFDVWSGKIRHDPYYSFHGQAESGQTKRVHAYPPWEYTYFLPLSLVPKITASAIFGIIQVASLLYVASLLFRWGRSLRGRTGDGLFVVAGGLSLGASIGFAFWFRQYGLTNLALLALMFRFLNRGRQIPAGICWAMIMAKPQVGLPLFIPLLFGRQWKAMGTAVAVCCLAAIPPAIMCHSSPVDMILEIRSSGGNVLTGTSILPKPLFTFLANAIHPAFPALASAGIGIFLCVWLSFRLRTASVWLVRFLPALVCATGWTYLQLHDKTLFLFPQAVLAVFIICKRSWNRRLALSGLMLLGVASLGAYVHASQTSWIHNLIWHLPSGLPSQAAYAAYAVGSFLQFFGICAFLHIFSSELIAIKCPFGASGDHP